MSQLKAIFSSFQDLIGKCTAANNIHAQNDQLDTVAQVCLTPPEADLLRPTVTAANVCIEPPDASSSSLIPDACLREVIANCHHLGFYLYSALKEKLWKGDYVDILSLLPLHKEYRPDRKDSDRFEDDKQKSPLRSFNNWLQAFCICSSVLREKRPDLCLFQHIEIILEAYKSFPGLSWFAYDESFRQKLLRIDQ